ncbi:MAG: hypothetical protein LC803_18690 [Acidobacteria bacterium]|nr:hypothetical protein [Acidobacteriota bacterium]
MAIPQPVLDILNKLQIVGLPTLINPGEILRPQINPGLEAFDALGLGEVLGNLDLNLSNVVLSLTQMTTGESDLSVTLDAIADASGKAPGTTDVQVVMEAVEFNKPAPAQARDLNPDMAARGELPYLTPISGSSGYLLQLGTNVQGLIGKVAGEIKQVEKMTGSVRGRLAPLESLLANITGKVTGAITGPKLLDAAPKVSVQWHIEGNYVLLDNTTLNNKLVPPVLVVLPEFAELTNTPPPPSQLRISCDVSITVTLPGGATESKTRPIGPFNIEVPKIQIPVLAAFTEHGQSDASQFPGRVLMAVPSSSPLSGLNNLKSFLQPVQTVLARLQQTLTVANATLALQFGEASNVIGTLIDIIGAVNQPLITQNFVMYLSSITLDPGGWFGVGYKSWEDEISSVLLIGPPGTGISCHNRRNLWQGTGQFKVIVGMTGAAFVLDLVEPVIPDGSGGYTSRPDCVPSDTTFEVVVQPDNSRRIFNDVISSFQFLPLA